MKSLDALTTSHLRQRLRPQRSAWFAEEVDDDDDMTNVVRMIDASSTAPSARRPRELRMIDRSPRRLQTIGSLVSLTPWAVTDGTPLEEIQQLLVEQHLTAVPVVDPARSLCGVVTSADLLRASADSTAGEAMSNAVTIRSTASVEAAAALVAREHVDHVVVTDPVGQPIGIVTANAIIRFLADR